MGKASRIKRERRWKPDAFPRFKDKGNEILICYRIPKSIPEEKITAIVFQQFKLSFLENGRAMARDAGDSYEVLQSFLSQAEAGRFKANLRDNPIEGAEEIPAPATRDDSFQPIAQVLPEVVTGELEQRMTTDSDLVISTLSSLADRQGKHPDTDFFIPHLPPEVYQFVRNMQKKKPQ